jgi:hypothetical protein
LEGTILSHNTLGGGYALLIADGEDYNTPWGTSAELATNEGYQAWVTKGKNEEEIAQAYDMHLMRYYKPEYEAVEPFAQVNGDDCSCINNGTCTTNSSSDCYENNNAFVIRTDGRIKQLPPPGFEVIAKIKR